MKNIKLEKALFGTDWWKGAKILSVPGDPTAESVPDNLSKEEQEKIIQGWKKIAVIQAEPSSTAFRIFYIYDGNVIFLKYPIETLNGKFGMRIGKEDAQFFAVDSNFQEPIQLTLIEVVSEDDPKYSELPLY